jgi:hypothetical protein
MLAFPEQNIMHTCFLLAKSDHLTFQKYTKSARRLWLTPIILATQEAEIRRIVIKSHETPSRKYPIQNMAGKVAQVLDC